MTTPWPADAWYLQLADLTIDLRFRRLIHSGQSIELPQRVFDLCLLLLSEPNRLHTRTELFDRLWAGTIVEDTNLSQNVWLLRKALGEERKGWIRTVAKSGYVFEPPAPVQWFSELPPAPQPIGTAVAPHGPQAFSGPSQRDRAADTVRPGTEPAEPTEPEASAPLVGLLLEPAASSALPSPVVETKAMAAPLRSLRGSPRTWVLISLGLIAVVTLAVLFVQRADRLAAGERELAVALVAIEDQNPSSRWPAKLLEEWLSWKLGSLPEVNLLSEGDLAAGNAPASTQVVFLSSVRSPNDPGKIALYLRFQENGEEQRLEAKGTAAEMPALVDSMSRQLLARLLPAREAPWPALELSANAAQRYEQAVGALDRRDWMSAVSIGGEVVEAAPRFGLMRLQLAQAQARLAQAAAATAQMELAIELLAPAPVEVRTALESQRLSLDPRRAQDALKAMASLADRHPDKVAYRLEYARLLIAAGEPQGALARLADRSSGGEAMGERITTHLLRAEAYRVLGDFARMRTEAAAAEHLARDAGPGWNLERADALLLTARADSVQFPQRPVSAAYERSALLYEQSGNSTGALHARVLARIAGPLTGADPALDALLARANAGGYHRLEIDVLVASADQYIKSGDADAYRSRLLQASAAANASGDLLSMSRLDFKLALNDLLTARFDSAAVRVARLRSVQVQGLDGLFINQLAAMLSGYHGRPAEAVEILNRTERLLMAPSPGQASSEAYAQLACERAEYLLTLGRLPQARKDFELCSQATRPVMRNQLVLTRSYADLLGGDRAQAAALLRQAESSLPAATPDRWIQLLKTARLSLWLGEGERSERIYSQLLPQLQPTGFTLFIAQATTGLAENAAARGDWKSSRFHAAEVRRMMPGEPWFLSSRLDLLAAADARQRGDRSAAIATAGKLHQRARQLGDAIVEMQVHGMFEPGVFEGDCSAAAREALVARTGMRGVKVDWLGAVSPAAATASQL